jgi:HEAT repeat protein
MTRVLEKAQDAVQQGNWSQACHYVQEFLVDRQEDSLLETEMEPLLAIALAVLQFGEFQDRWDIAKVFPYLDESAIAPLVALLQDETTALEVCWFVLRILANFDDPEAIQAMIDVLQGEDEEDEELRVVAAESLATVGPAAIAALTTLLPNLETRRLAVQSLAQIRLSATIPPLLSVVHDPQPAIRTLAIEALSSFHDDQIPLVLIAALTDPVASVRRAAIAGLGVRTDLVADLNLDNLLADRLWDLNLDVCQQAAIALGRFGTEAAAAHLLRGLKAPHTPIPLQLEIVRALGWIGTAVALESLCQALGWIGQSDALTVVYQEIITTLGQWNSAALAPQAAQIILDALATTPSPVKQPEVKQAIALALGRLQQPIAIDPLIDLLADDHPGVRLHAIAALRILDAETAHQRLQLLASREDLPAGLRQGIAIALQEWPV